MSGGAVALDLLARGAAAIGIELTPEQLDRFERFAVELDEWNRRMNLTRVVKPGQVQSRHFLDSLTCALPVLPQLRSGAKRACIDVGSGAGFPGLPLAIAFPDLRVVLLEATRKKTSFLEHVVGALGLERVSVVTGRAEEAARQSAHRDAYDLACARALAPLPVALEWCLPFVRPGGHAILPRGSDLPSQLASGRLAARQLGAELWPPRPISLADLPPGRALVVAEKTGPTPREYPRRPGRAAKRPLGFP